MQRVTARFKRRQSLWENGMLVLIAAAGFAFAYAAGHRGIALKWVTALFGTILPFALVIFLHRRNLPLPYWISLSICLAVHCAAIFVVFEYVLVGIERFSPLLWLPFMLAEFVGLLVVIPRLEHKLTGHRDATRLTF